MTTEERMLREHDEAFSSFTQEQRKALDLRDRAKQMTHFWGGDARSCLRRLIAERAKAHDAAVERSRLATEFVPLKEAA